MKIVCLTEFFPKSEIAEITGGVEARCFYISKEFQNKGHDFIILADKTDGKRWAHMSFKTIFTGAFFYLRTVIRAFSILFKDIDLIEGTNYTTYPLAWLVAKIKRVPVVFWYPDVFIGEWVKNIGLAGLMGEIIERLILKLPVEQYIAISLSTKNKLIESGVDQSKIKLIYCGIDEKEISKVFIKKPPVIYDLISVTRLVSYKRVSDLIYALSLVKKKIPNVKLAIVGQGPEKRNLEMQAKRLGLTKNIDFTGYVPSHLNVLELIASSRLLCLASMAEGFGIVAIESAALGIPTVLSDLPVLREITHEGKGGLMFKLGDSEDLAEKVLLLFSDKNLYLQKSEEAKKLAKEYSWKTISLQTETVYKSLLPGFKSGA